MKRPWKIVLALVLGYAWVWTGWLKDNHYVDENFRLKILALLSVGFVAQQVGLTAPKPVDRSSVDQRRRVIELKLSVLLNAYYRQLQTLGTAITPAVRVNVALPTRRRFGWRMMIYYTFAPTGPYSNDELEMRFRKGEGAIGRAWKEKNIVLYDRQNARFSSSKTSVRKGKMLLLSSIQSVLTVPMLANGEVVGALSLDSEFSINETKFDQRAISLLAQTHAYDLAGLCFSDGVKYN